MIMWHFKHKGMCIRISYKNVKTSLPILKKGYVSHAKDRSKDIIVITIEKNAALEEDEFMSTPTMLQEYNYCSLTQKNDGLRCNIQIIDL